MRGESNDLQISPLEIILGLDVLKQSRIWDDALLEAYKVVGYMAHRVKDWIKRHLYPSKSVSQRR